MPFLEEKREYRYFQSLTPPILQAGETEESPNPYMVEGYASTWERYPLFEEDGITYYEQISPTAFSECDCSDIIFQYNHEGPVFARTRNNTLEISTDEHGLKVVADLSKTTKSRELFEDISTGNIDKMSFAFVVAEDTYDQPTHTRTITKIKKVYDVSAVSIPANETTSITTIGVATRSAFDGYINAEKQEMLREEQRQRKQAEIKLKLKITGIQNQ